MKLFIDLYTDEDVDVLVADLLRGRGAPPLAILRKGRFLVP